MHQLWLHDLHLIWSDTLPKKINMKLPVKGLAYKVVGATAKISSVSSDPKKNSLIENMLSSSFAHHIDKITQARRPDPNLILC